MKNQAASILKQVPSPEAPAAPTPRGPGERGKKARLSPVAKDASPAPFLEGEQQEIEVDGRRIVFTAKDEIVLRCGKSSITLTRAGKIIISGEYVVSRSSGVNRIRGGSVQIN